MEKELKEIEVGCCMVHAIGQVDVRITSRPTRATLYYPGDPLEWEATVEEVHIIEVIANDVEPDDEWPSLDQILDTVADCLRESVDHDEVCDMYYNSRRRR